MQDTAANSEGGIQLSGVSPKETREVPRFPKDLEFAQVLLSGDKKAWEDLHRSLSKKSGPYIEHYYPGAFNDQDKEDIVSDLMERLLARDKRVLGTYRGMQSLSTHIENQLKWAVKTAQRKRIIGFFETKDDIENIESYQDANLDEQVQTHRPGTEIPHAVMRLPDNQRRVFLLRYYDDFGFPEHEIALLAKELEKNPDELSRLINELLEPTGADALAKKKKKLAALLKNIEKLQITVYFLSLEEQKMLRSLEERLSGGIDPTAIEYELAEIRRKNQKTTSRLKKALLEKEGRFVGTSYKIIGQIVNESNQNTLRSRLKTARDTLAKGLERRRKERNVE